MFGPDASRGRRAARRLLRLMTGYWVSQAIFAAARLGIADLLEQGPRSVDELAEVTGAHELSLYRLLRALASVEVFAEREDGRFELTPLAHLLRSGVPGSRRPGAILLGEPWRWRPWGELLHSVRSGQPAFDHLYGTGEFEYMAEHPEAGRVFDEAMTSASATINPAVTAAYDFSTIGTIVDVGGGQGSLLVAILKSNPSIKGVLADLPHVVVDAPRRFEAAGLGGRYEVVATSFFESVPAGGDAYILKAVIHDWDDERAVAILGNCRRAMAPGGRLLVVETVIPPGNEPFYGKFVDLNLLVMTTGRERTEAEFRRLFDVAGFSLTRIVPTRSALSIIEATLA